MERKDKNTRQEHEQDFDRDACIRHSLSEVSPIVPNPVGYGVNLLRFMPGEVIAEHNNNTVELQFLNDELSDLRANYQVGSSDFDRAHDEFVVNIREKALLHGLLDDVDIAWLDKYWLTPRVIEDIEGQQRTGFGVMFNRGWEVFRHKEADNAVLVNIHPNKREFSAINLDVLASQEPEFVEEEVKKLYRAQLVQQMDNNVTYNLRAHEVDRKALVPQVLEELARVDELTLLKMQNFLALATRDETGAVFVDNLVRRLPQRQVEIPGERRNMYLDYFLKHISTCPAEAEETRAEATKQAETLAAITSTNYPRTSEYIKFRGQEWLHDPLHYTEDFMQHGVSLEKHEQETAKDFVKLIDSTKSRFKSVDSMMKYLRRRNRRLYDLNQRFMEALGEDYFKKSNYEQFIKDAVTSLGLELKEKGKESIIGRGVENLDDAADVIGKALYTKTSSMGGKVEQEWVSLDRHDQYQPKKVIKDHDLLDLQIYIALKTLQQREMQKTSGWLEPKTRRLAEKMMGELRNKYSKRANESRTAVNRLQERSRGFNKFIKDLGIPKSLVTKLVHYVERDPVYGHRNFDYTKFNKLFNTLVYAKMGIIDLKSPATKAVLRAVYPSVKEEEWDLLR